MVQLSRLGCSRGDCIYVKAVQFFLTLIYQAVALHVDAFCCRCLILLYEPEAAAMAVIKHQMQPVPFVEGNTFVVVDAGGGTVDITTHEVVHCRLLSEMAFVP